MKDITRSFMTLLLKNWEIKTLIQNFLKPKQARIAFIFPNIHHRQECSCCKSVSSSPLTKQINKRFRNISKVCFNTILQAAAHSSCSILNGHVVANHYTGNEFCLLIQEAGWLCAHCLAMLWEAWKKYS